MTLQGKGFYLWEVPRCEGGDPNAIAAAVKSGNLTHLLVKICDGTINYPGKWEHPVDLTPGVVQALKAAGIQVWGWHYVYGKNPIAEADVAIARIQQLGVEGYIIDAEKEYKELENRKDAARKYMARLRAALPGFPIALSSYRYPSLHPQLPWREFLDSCSLAMPQVYWMQAHNPGAQLQKSLKEYKAMYPALPYIPTGVASIEGGWKPTVAEEIEFLQTAVSLGLPAANFWELGEARSGLLPGLWEAIRDYPWPGSPPPMTDICEKLFAAINAHNLDQVVALYTAAAGFVTASGTIQGTQAIREWYAKLFTQTLPGAAFKLTGFSGTGATRQLTWTAVCPTGKVQDGKSNLGLISNQIGYHYMAFTVTK
jgi:hypothetical protein